MTKRKTPDDYGGIDAVYRDQAPYRTGWGYYSFFACYTPEGIRMRESGYIRRILDFNGGKKERLALANEIRRDPHLHQVIKRDLIANLRER